MADSVAPEREQLANLLGFAQGVLNARTPVQMTMAGGLGIFHEGQVAGLPGVRLNEPDGTWLRIDRLRETRPPGAPEHVATFLAIDGNDPAKPPQLLPSAALEVPIEEASDLEEAGLLRPDDVHVLVENGIEIENRVRVILHADACKEMRRDFERWLAGPWADWAAMEKPIRRTISLHNDLFKLYQAIHNAEATPPELVWGMGIGRWKTAGTLIDMPLIEQQADIEIEENGAMAIRPRDLPPTLSLKPYLDIEVDGAARLQRQLQSTLQTILGDDAEISPFAADWEPLAAAATAQLAATGVHVTRAELDAGSARLEPAGEALRFTSSWAIFGRPRSAEARLQDLETLKREVLRADGDLPAVLTGFVCTPPPRAQPDTSDWGLESSVLQASDQRTTGWQTGSDGATPGIAAGPIEPSATPHGDGAGTRVHFFPLPFNAEQGQIIDFLGDPANNAVTISGPPGTGKTHSIANIISHLMATGKRVLVTARTPEAIAAVREKLPEALRPLVIASTGTDRESAKHLQEAVSELSGEVVGMNTKDALAQKDRLEREIVACDEEARKADTALARIAEANLAALTWKGETYAPMTLVEVLAKDGETFGWFTDRPSKPPPAQLEEAIVRLGQRLPTLAPDIAYGEATLPDPEDIPSTADLIAAHDQERARIAEPVIDYSLAPPMARDAYGADDLARNCLTEFEAVAPLVAGTDPRARQMAAAILSERESAGRADIDRMLSYIDGTPRLDRISEVRYDPGQIALSAMSSAAERGAADQKPVGFSLFNKSLKAAVDTVTIDGQPPSGADDWRTVYDACRLAEDHENLATIAEPLVDANMLAPLPQTAWEIAAHLQSAETIIRTAQHIAAHLRPCLETLGRLFPFGLDIGRITADLSLPEAIFALKGNLPDPYAPPMAIAALRSTAGTNELEVFATLRGLAEALGTDTLTQEAIVKLRGDLTRELERIAALMPQLKEIAVDLAALEQAGAPEWATCLRNRPLEAETLIPPDWQMAWSWAIMRARVDRIIELGNGDTHRAAKAKAMTRRRRRFEELIRIRTLLGLQRRMTPGVKQAMSAFTEAVSRIGGGTGKNAPRFRRAAQEAARAAAPAAPVWVMPEYKIPEQLPAELGDFDLVILDEASQSDITALAALARGKKVLIVGDEEQVSPSAVGIPTQKINALRAEFLQNLPNANLVDGNTSIFALSKRMHPDTHLMLREHFRCVAPIIQFSTRFYQNRLMPLRVPKASERFDPPLVDVYIPRATRQGKTNRSEAAWIVDEIARLIADPAHAWRDIGVISLIGNEQSKRIGRMLVEDPRIGTETIEKHRIIVGDARTMQGQERSVVFLSMVATPRDVIAQSRPADQQRINVAMSRAKDRLYLVRSVALNHLRPNDIKADVLKHFADPMPDGRTLQAERADLMDRCQSGFEREVLGRLINANYRVRPQLAAGGFSIDLVVEGAEDRRLAIELDGDAYHGPEVWERDMARQAALERAGWTFWRVFGSQWKASTEYWWRDLTQTLERMGIKPIGAAPLDERFAETIIVDPLGDDPEMGEPPAAEPQEPQPPEISDAEAESGLELATTGFATEQGQQSDWIPTSLSSLSEQALEGDAPQRSGYQPNAAAMEPPPDTNGHAETREPHDVLGDNRSNRASVSIGSQVRIEKLFGDGGKMLITIVEAQNDLEQGIVGAHTPLGAALIDAETGETVEYQAGPYLREVRVLDVQ